MKRANITTFFSITGVLVFAAVVFIYGLDATSLWADEGWTIAATDEANPIDVVDKWVIDDVHPPLFFMGLNVWRMFTGDTIFEMRYYSALLSLISVAGIYRLGRAVFSVKTGLIVAFLFTVHDLVLVLTQEVRHYPQQQLLTIVTMWLYWRFWQSPTRNRAMVFAIAGTALLYSHYWGGFVLLALAVHALFTRLKTLRSYIMANVAIGVMFLPWLPAVHHQITRERPRGLPHALDNSWVVYETLANQLAGIPETFWLVMAGIGVFGTLHIFTKRDWLPSVQTMMPTLVVVLTVGMSLLINTQYPTLSFRSLAVVIPALMLLVAHTLSQFRTREFAIVMSFIVLHSLFTTGARPVERPPWPDLATYVSQHSTSTDVVFLEMDTDDLPFIYYLEQDDIAGKVISTETIRLNTPDDYPSMRDEALQQHNGVWLVKFGFFAYDPRPEIEVQGYVQSAPAILDYGRYADGRPIEVYRYDRVPDDDALYAFGDTMQLQRANTTINDNTLTINLLWTANTVPTRNYTISTFLLAENGLPATPPTDSYPFNGRSPTIDWAANTPYYDSHQHALDTLAAGRYRVGIKVYSFTDNSFTQLEVAIVSDCSDDPACEFIIIEEIDIN